jgi:hypothetical protein
MTRTTDIPITVQPDAAARVAELGMQREFQEMLDHTRQTVSDLHAIEVTLEYDPCEPGDPTVVIISYRRHVWTGDDPTDRNWGAWFVRQYSPDVVRHFVMLSCYGEPDAR